MKTKELIDLLQQQDPESIPIIERDGEYFAIETVTPLDVCAVYDNDDTLIQAVILK